MKTKMEREKFVDITRKQKHKIKQSNLKTKQINYVNSITSEIFIDV